MRTRISHALFVALAAVLAYAALHLTWAVQQLRNVGDQLREDRAFAEEDMGTTVTVSWTSGNKTITVTTTKGDDETDAEWATRTQAAVDAQENIFPPN